MKISKDELIWQIEQSREKLNNSIDLQETYDSIYENSVELDHLIELYMGSEF